MHPTATRATSHRVLRAWPPELGLTEHLRAAYTPVLDSSDTDTDTVLAVIRLTHDEPALRATYLALRERSEDMFAEVLAERMGQQPEIVDRHREQLTNAISLVIRGLSDEGGD